jgi:glycosyltransferase involved in cell wall biosynthesis
LFDLFALSSYSEQFPISVVEAMAAGLAVAAPAVGDLMDMVAEPNRPYIAPRGDFQALCKTIGTLTSDAQLRASIGAANRAKAQAEYGEDAMIAAYRSVYGAALGKAAFP